MSGGGAAGFELDRADVALGTPPNALILARSEAHQRHFVVVPEELLTHVTTVTGERSKALVPRPRSSISRRLPAAPCSQPARSPTVEKLGTVKWYNASKGFGFIGPDRSGKDIFVHASALERSGVMDLAEGQRVAVEVADGQKWPEAVSLRLI